MDKRISVVLCTRNRAAELAAALESLARQTLPSRDFEILVVDNGSMDETMHVHARFAAEHPSIASSMIREPSIGLAKARNTGLGHVRTEYVAFTDDDCLPAQDWLERILEAFTSVSPQPRAVGGIVVPLVPPGFPESTDMRAECDSWGESARFLSRGESFSGNNMAFRTELFGHLGPFDESLGMKGDELAVGEDTDMFLRIHRRFGRSANIYYSPRIVTFHRVAASRLKTGYRLKRAFAEGQALSRISSPRPLQRLGYLPWGVAKLAVGLVLVVIPFASRGLRRPPLPERMARPARESGRILGCLGVQLSMRERAGH